MKKLLTALIVLLALSGAAEAQIVRSGGGSATVSTSFNSPLFVNGAQSATGNIISTTCTGAPGTGTGCVVVAVTGLASAGFTISGTYSATLQFESSADGGTTYSPLQVTPTGSSSQVTSTTGTGNWTASVGGMTHVRVRASAYTSGTAVATINAVLAGGSSGGAGGSTPTGSAGTPNASVVSVQGISSMTPVQVSQATAGNLNATVVGTGTFAVQAAQSGTWTVQPGNTANTTPWLVAGNATPANAFANPTNAITVWALTACSNGTTWDKCPTSDGGSGSSTANTTRTITSSDSPDVAVLGATGDAAVTTSAAGSISAKLRGIVSLLNSGIVVQSHAVTNAGTFAVQASPTAATSGGATPGNYISAASNNSTNLKASAGTLYSMTVINTTATLKYIRLYDLSTAPTCTSATGVVFYSPIPANSTTGAGFVLPLPVGANFANGIGWCITGGAGTTDNTSTASGDVVLNYSYK